MRRSVTERLISKAVEDANGCWVWIAHKTRSGYGRFRLDGRMVMAHRLSYEMHIASIPPGLSIDHLCRNRACINPWHLEPVTVRENNLRGMSASGISARGGHCPQGHEFTPTRDGRRHCPCDGGLYVRHLAKPGWDKEKRKWRSVVIRDFKRHHLGYFTDYDEAQRAIIAAAVVLDGAA